MASQELGWRGAASGVTARKAAGPVASPGVPGLDALTPSERLIWTGQQLDPAAPLYNMALAITLPIPLDRSAFQEAFQRLVDSTDALRTVFLPGATGTLPRRLIHESLQATVEFLELPEGTHDDAAVEALLGARTRRHFDQGQRLFDACVVVRGPRRHIWYLNQHHLITDAWSVGVLHRRLSALYQDILGAGDRTDREASVSLPPQFAEYVEHQRVLAGSPRLAEAVAFWDSRAADAGSPLSLYGVGGRGSGTTQRIRVPFDASRADALRRTASLSPFRALTSAQSRFHLMATALLAWLHRIADAPTVAIGMPWHNRSSVRFRETAGLFMELFPLEVAIEEGETFASLGRKVAEGTRAMLRHVVPGASSSPGARAFEVVLNYITAELGEFAGAPVEAEWIHSGSGDAQHRVRLQVHDFHHAGVPRVELDLDAAVFPEPVRAWAVHHFGAMFDALVLNPEAVVGAVELTTLAEAECFAPPGPSAPPAEPVLAQFHAVVRRSPDAVAIHDGDLAITYAGLDAAARRMSAQLVASGAVAEATVGLALGRSPELVMGMLAVHAAGAAFVPLDPAYPDERLRFLVADAGIDLVLTTPALAPRVRRWGATPVLVPPASGWELAAPGSPAPAPPRGSELAYVLYTSGSTGQPKGVEITHDAIADYIGWAARRYGDRAGLTWPLFTSPAFDLTLTSILVPLVSGGSIIVYRDDASGGALLVRRVFEDNLVDVVKLTPSHLELVRDLDLADSRVRRLIVGGEDLPRATALALHAALGGRAEILNEYGPTEATVACTLHRFQPDRDLGSSVPIGRPADNVRVEVRDGNGRLQPRGVAGEIWLGGPRLARGYRGQPELTARSFVPDRYRAGERLYRTGDLGRWMPDGTLEFLGRRDEQVKVRGVRLELREVEAAVAAHPEVTACVAHLRAPDPPDRARRCGQCGLEGAHPEARLDQEGVCAVCRRFAGERENVARYFGTMEDLAAVLAAARRDASGPQDCLMLYSGGKDSTYALSRIVELGARPLVMLFDNGFISDQAKANVRRVVETLGLELVVGETPAMPAIFAESLSRFSNVCNGCYKAIYTFAMNLALDRGIRHIVTGLSRGQIFETRLAGLYRRGIYDPATVDRTILEARKAYHRMDDAVSRGMDTARVASDAVLDRIQFVDFFRYCDASLDEILAHLHDRMPWVRPTDTGRSTNCLINQAGIFVHQAERGFHNYALPYSWDVRLGHKTRDAAVTELDDALDPAEIRNMLDRVGYRERPPVPAAPRLVAYYTAAHEIPPSDLRRTVEQVLPADVVPTAFVRLEQLPLAASGKVDRGQLPQPESRRLALAGVHVAPRSETEHLLAELWGEVLDVGPISVHDDFFELGGDSIRCVQIVAAARSRGAQLEPRDLFAHRTIAALAAVVRQAEGEQHAPAAATDQELAELLEEFGDPGRGGTA